MYLFIYVSIFFCNWQIYSEVSITIKILNTIAFLKALLPLFINFTFNLEIIYKGTKMLQTEAVLEIWK